MQTEIFGTQVRLRPLTDADLRRRAKWTGDKDLAVLMGVDIKERPLASQHEQLDQNRKWLKLRQAKGDVLYAIEAEGKYIGDIDIVIIPKEHKAEITLFIGDRNEWGKGYGRETVKLVLDDLFSLESVDTVEIDVAAQNQRALRFWKKLGFQEYRIDDRGTRYLRYMGKGYSETGSATR